MGLLNLVELNGSGNGVRRAAVQSALLINRRTIWAQIDPVRQSAQQFTRGLIMKIAMIGQIRNPAVEALAPSR